MSDHGQRSDGRCFSTQDQRPEGDGLEAMLLSQNFFVIGKIAFWPDEDKDGFGVSQRQLMKTP